jgi:L-fuconolactonase
VSVVDGHCHVSTVWYEPVETLLGQMDRNGVAQAVLIQILGQYANDYQQCCLRRYPGRFASVVAVDPAAPDADERLRVLAADGATGVRLRPGDRSPGPDPLAIWRTAERLGLAISCVGTRAQFAAPAFADLVDTMPGLRFVLEHLAGVAGPDVDGAEAADRRRALALARFPNVYVKLPGLGELSKRPARLAADGPPLERRPEILDAALEHFGAERLIWGSDFPVVAAREGYANALHWVDQALAGTSDAARARIFGGNARDVFRLSEP